jgi:hypothetical protein
VETVESPAGFSKQPVEIIKKNVAEGHLDRFPWL